MGFLINDISCINSKEWSGVKCIGMTVLERLVIHRDGEDEIIEEEPTPEVCTYIISKEMNAEEFACYVKNHWRIEDSLHWVLDDYFREDRCTARKRKATENLGLLRKMAYNLMKLDPNVSGKSMKWREVYYRNNIEKIAELLFLEIPSRY